MEKIFEKYDDNIIRAEYRDFNPTSVLNLNTENRKTIFSIDGSDCFLDLKSTKFNISGKVVQLDDTEYPLNSNIKLENGFPSKLFSNIQLKKHGTLLEEIENPGITSNMKGVVGFALNNNHGPTINSGYQSRFKGGGKFNVYGNLSDFGLGFFEDITYPLYKGDIQLEFTRNHDHDALFKEENSDKKMPTDGKIIIEDFRISFRVVKYDSMSKTLLINELVELSEKNNYFLDFKTIKCIEVRKLSGKKCTLDITNMYRNSHDPLFGIVGLQTNRNTQLKESSNFDHCNVRNIYFEINGEKYPEEMLNIDFKNDKFGNIYDMLGDYKKVFYKTYRELPLIYTDPEQFKNSKPLFVINLTRQPVSISGSKHTVILNIDFDGDVSDGTVCYICLVSSNKFVYDIIQNSIREIR